MKTVEPGLNATGGGGAGTSLVAKSFRALRALSLLSGATNGRACSTTANCSAMSTSFNLGNQNSGRGRICIHACIHACMDG